MEIVSSSSSSASDNDYDDKPLLCVSECTRMHLITPKFTKIFWESMLPDCPRVNDCHVAILSTSANDIAPPPPKMEKVMYSISNKPQ